MRIVIPGLRQWPANSNALRGRVQLLGGCWVFMGDFASGNCSVIHSYIVSTCQVNNITIKGVLTFPPPYRRSPPNIGRVIGAGKTNISLRQPYRNTQGLSPNRIPNMPVFGFLASSRVGCYYGGWCFHIRNATILERRGVLFHKLEHLCRECNVQILNEWVFAADFAGGRFLTYRLWRCSSGRFLRPGCLLSEHYARKIVSPFLVS